MVLLNSINAYGEARKFSWVGVDNKDRPSKIPGLASLLSFYF